MAYTEANYENAVIEVFTGTLGYGYAHGPDIARDYTDPLYMDELLPACDELTQSCLKSPLTRGQ